MSERLSPEVLKEIRALEAAATPGPWRKLPGSASVVTESLEIFNLAPLNKKNIRANVDFLISSRDDVPALLSHVEALESEMEISGLLDTQRERDELQRLIDTLFPAIEHGDAKHRKWLLDKINEHFKTVG